MLTDREVLASNWVTLKCLLVILGILFNDKSQVFHLSFLCICVVDWFMSIQIWRRQSESLRIVRTFGRSIAINRVTWLRCHFHVNKVLHILDIVACIPYRLVIDYVLERCWYWKLLCPSNCTNFFWFRITCSLVYLMN